jgi:large subunit ribosomal protein L18
MLNRHNTPKQKRTARTRAKIARASARPRLSVFRSNKAIYAQIIDDTKQVTLAAASGKDPKVVGQQVGKKALAANVKTVVFDRSSYNYHGQVKLLAEAAREAGLQF